jgi:hypothetical protein
MDAIVTIQILDGKRAIGTIEKAVEIHPAISADIEQCPAIAANWILSQARERIQTEGAEVIAPKQIEKRTKKED